MPDPPYQYADDPEGIPSGSLLIRRLPAGWVKWGSGDPPLPSTQAFQMYSQEMATKAGCPAPAMSVFLGDHPEASLDNLRALFPGDGFLSFGVDLLRGLPQGFGVMPWCYREDHHPAHAVVFRRDGGSKIPGSAQTKLAEESEWLWLPERPAS